MTVKELYEQAKKQGFQNEELCFEFNTPEFTAVCVCTQIEFEIAENGERSVLIS